MSNTVLDSHEIWKPVESSIYEVSNLGNVRNGRTLHVLKTQNKHGYRRINLRINGKDKNCSVHRLVAIAFIPNPDDKPQVNHKDGNKSNNNVDNLEWVTEQENFDHAVKNRLVEKGKARAKANGGSSGYNRKDKPKAHLRKSEIMTDSEFDYVVNETQRHGISVYLAVKGYFDSKPISSVVESTEKRYKEWLEKLKEENDALKEKIRNGVEHEQELKNVGIYYDSEDFAVGKKYNYLTIIGYAYQYPEKKTHKLIVCRCECGNIKAEVPFLLKNGAVKSCGCKQNDLLREANPIDIKKQDWLHSVWKRSYRKPEWYDGWREYDTFYEWAYANGYSFGKHLHRINTDEHYSPINCRWKDKIQNNGSANAHKVRGKTHECNGESLTVRQAAKKYKVGEQYLRYRMSRGMTLEEAVNTPKCTNGRKKNVLISA